MREPAHKYIPGNHLLTCDECGFVYRYSEMKKRWDGAMVCSKDFEPKHPQESVRARSDKIHVPVARPDISFEGGVTFGGDDDVTFGGEDVTFGGSSGSIDYITTPITADDL